MGIVLAVTVVLSGCNSDSTIEKQLSITVTEMNNAEKAFRDAQVELRELEKSEQELFNETKELTQQQLGELKIKVTELEELLGQRLAYIEGEGKSIRKAGKIVVRLDGIIEQADTNAKKSIEQLVIFV